MILFAKSLNQVHGITLGEDPEDMMHHPQRLSYMMVAIASNCLPDLDAKHSLFFIFLFLQIKNKMLC